MRGALKVLMNVFGALFWRRALLCCWPQWTICNVSDVICVYVYIYIYIYMYTCIYAYICIALCLTHVCVYIYIYIYIYVHMSHVQDGLYVKCRCRLWQNVSKSDTQVDRSRTCSATQQNPGRFTLSIGRTLLASAMVWGLRGTTATYEVRHQSIAYDAKPHLWGGTRM